MKVHIPRDTKVEPGSGNGAAPLTIEEMKKKIYAPELLDDRNYALHLKEFERRDVRFFVGAIITAFLLGCAGAYWLVWYVGEQLKP